MSLDIKLIFGLRTSGPVTLIVTGPPGTPRPDLKIRTHGKPSDTVVACLDNKWTAALTAGDHVVWLEAPGSLWFAGDVTFTLSAPSLIVTYDPAGSPKPGAWTDTTGAVRDPKNPWPPPRFAEVVSDPNWFGDTLGAFSGEISVARSAPHLGTQPPRAARFT